MGGGVGAYPESGVNSLTHIFFFPSQKQS